MSRVPMVFLVGAGPGDPGLITRRGLELIRNCDVLLYDRLVDPRLVDEASPDAERIFVGKTPGTPSRPQAEIDALIVEHARKDQLVVRLKGGDPFVFGRGADEAQALAAAGISFEIVPGVTSAIAVPAYAGIPVTHSGASSSFAVLSAHESAARPDAQQRWDDVARGAGTLVLLMGVAGLEDTTARLIAAGRDPNEPSAVIERGTLREQRTIVASLSTIAEAAREANIEAPAITITGTVVRLRDALSWFESKPLFGRRIVVTRPSAQAAPLRELLESHGAEVVTMPLIATEPLESFVDLDAALSAATLGGFHWIVFASRNAVDVVAARLIASRTTLGADTKIAAVGPTTKDRLERFGIEVDVVAKKATGAGLGDEIGPGPGDVLTFGSLGRPSAAAAALARAGWQVVTVPAYRTVEVDPSEADRAIIDTGAYDALIFASGSAVESFVAAFGPPEKSELQPADGVGPRIVAIGPSTAAVLERRGFRVDGVATRRSDEGITEALLGIYAPHR